MEKVREDKQVGEMEKDTKKKGSGSVRRFLSLFRLNDELDDLDGWLDDLDDEQEGETPQSAADQEKGKRFFASSESPLRGKSRFTVYREPDWERFSRATSEASRRLARNRDEIFSASSAESSLRQETKPRSSSASAKPYREAKEKESGRIHVYPVKRPQREGFRTSSRRRNSRRRRQLFFTKLAAAAIIVLLAVIFVSYNRTHTFTGYTILASYENTVESGTFYEAAGHYLYRYSADGIACVNLKNELKWSVTYNMQNPIADVCEDVMAVAEQQGNQVYLVDSNGLIGNFTTELPILKVRVSANGIVAVILEEEEVTWVNLYQTDGTLAASVRTTVSDPGYPLDAALSPDGQKLMVSYLNMAEGIITSKVTFYHFGSAGKEKENHEVAAVSYQETVIPQVYFVDDSTAVAVTDEGFLVFSGSDEPEESASVSFEQEIVSVFHDEETIGFLFQSEEEGYSWHMELYNYRGANTVTKELDTEFESLKMENGQIIFQRQDGCEIYTSYGQKRFSSQYEKEIQEIFYLSEYKRYVILTRDSLDRIKIKD